MLKLAENPPILAPGASTLAEFTGVWWVAYTKPRFEKAFAWNLHHMGIQYFLPMVERTRIISGKKRHVVLPLFPSYVFFRGTDDDRHAAMTTNRLCHVIDVIDQASLDKELLRIEQALLGKADLELCPYAAAGSRCRVSVGPFAGLEGTVEERAGRTRLVLRVDMLGQAVSMEVDADLLERIQ
jgi:transcription antitermination factor NusG